MTLLGPKRNACRQFTGGSFRVSLRLAPHPGHANAEGQVPVRARSRVKPTRPVAKGSSRNGRIPEVLDHLGNEMEKRLPIAMIVNLARAQNRNGTELTYTDNVSAHGACIVSNHPWQPGELAEITSMFDQIAMRGKVAHCRKRRDDQYTIGLSFPCEVVWSIYLRTEGRLQ